MCMILDADQWGDFLNAEKKNTPNMLRIQEWIGERKGSKRHGVLVYPSHGKFKKELDQSQQMREVLQRYVQSGAARPYSKERHDESWKKISKFPFTSNDPHVLAAFDASRATILCTGDKKLQQDFKNLRSNHRIRKGVIYTSGSPRDLLYDHRCPSTSKR